MSTKGDLQKTIQSLRDQLSAAQESLDEIVANENDLKLGMVVRHYKHDLTVSRLGVKYGRPRAYGRLTKKDGNLGAVEFEIYGNYKIIS